MSVSYLTGSHQTVTGSSGFSTKVAAIGGPAVVTRVSINGLIALQGAGSSLATTTYQAWNLSAGIQYGAAGYTVVQNTTGSIAGANYLTWNECLLTSPEAIWVPGSPPQAISDSSALALSQVWHGLFPVSTANDFYLVVGCDTSGTFVPNFKGSFSWSVQWATYP